jgi:hypothetical protein
MSPRRQTAGTMGIIAGIALLLLFILFFTSNTSMETFNDPASALAFMRDQAGRVRWTSYLAIITVAAAVPFVAGLASVLHDKAPTRATTVLYFGLVGLVGHGLGAFTFLRASPWLVATAARDQVAAAHAFVAVNGLSTAMDGVGNLFIGLSTLMAGWAIVATQTLGMVLGWVGVVAGIVIGLAALAPQVSLLYLGSFIAPIIWLIWAGYALRRTA